MKPDTAAHLPASPNLLAALDSLLEAIAYYDADDRLVFCNHAYRELYALSAEAIAPGTRFEDILRYGAERGQYASAIGRVEAWVAERLHQHQNVGMPIEQQLNNGRWLRILEHRTPDGGIIGVRYDITELKRAEETLRNQRVREEIVVAQDALLAELSTPLLRISEHVVVMPLIGAIDTRRAQRVMEALLQGIAEQQTRVAILDITGVPVVDTQVASALLRSAQAAQLLGAQVILTGIRSEIAQTLVGLGVDLGSIVTRNSLQDGIAYALAFARRIGV